MEENRKPLLSVIVPIYNVDLYLEKCLDSIRRQTYTDLQIILVDDGSTDTSPEICDKYRCMDNRIEVIHKKNGGIVSARKAGISVATGKYATYVDSDDWIDNNMYEELIAQIEENEADIVTSGLYREYKNSCTQEGDNVSAGSYEWGKMQREIFPVLMYTGTFYGAGINIHFYNKVFKKELLLKNQMQINDKVRIGDDAALVYSCFMDAKKVVITHKCYYHYCMRTASSMDMGYGEEFEGFKMIYDFLKNKIQNHKKHVSVLEKQLNYLMLYLFLLKEPSRIIYAEDKGRALLGVRDENAKIVLYGTGRFGCTLYRFIEEQKICKVIGRVDKSANLQKEIYLPEKLLEWKEEQYDKIIITVLVNSVAEEIEEELLEMGIPEQKIVRINYEMLEKEVVLLLVGQNE